MCRGRGAVVFCPGGRLVFQRSWGGSESEEPAERNLASVSCQRWLLSESARISLCVASTRRAGAGFPQTQLSVEQASRRWRVIRRGPARVELVPRPQHRRVLVTRGRSPMTTAPRSLITAKPWRQSTPSQSRGSESSGICTLRRGTSRARWQPHARSSPTPARPRPSRRRELSFSVFLKPTPWRRMRVGMRPSTRPHAKSVILHCRGAPRCLKHTRVHRCA
jgi:hypothetical protein